MIATTRYYEEFLRYSSMAATQQKESNLGTIPHAKGSIDDDLMRNVFLYDVVQRKYAGFTQLLLDIWYGKSNSHPYKDNLHPIREPICENFNRWRRKRTVAEMLFVFFIHRLTGSAINYARSPSGYWNTVLPEFYQASNIPEMVEIVRTYTETMYTSVGYQFPAFPKPVGGYKRGGDYFICEKLPILVESLSDYLSKGSKKTLRSVGGFLFDWNQRMGLRRYKFQYAAVIADIADFMPEYVEVYSPFFYGSNAIQCMSYMLEKPSTDNFDLLMQKASRDTGFRHYDLEDQMCDCIRWIENYIRPGGDYDHLDLNEVWSSHRIYDHPFGRQKAMLELGLVDFNKLGKHPTGDYVLRHVGISRREYRNRVRSLHD